MTTLQYKGYQGSVTFDNGHLLVQILHIDDFISAECDRASEAQKVFEELVDDYLETCEAVGKEPNKPFKGTFNVRVSPVLHRRAAMAASSVEDSLNAWIAGAITQRLEREQTPKPLVDLHLIEQRLKQITKQRTPWKVAQANFALTHGVTQGAFHRRDIQQMAQPDLERSPYRQVKGH